MTLVRFRLAELLTERKMTQSALSEQLGVSQNTIKAYYHNHVQRPDLEIVARLCDFFSVGLDELMVLEKQHERV